MLAINVNEQKWIKQLIKEYFIVLQNLFNVVISSGRAGPGSSMS